MLRQQNLNNEQSLYLQTIRKSSAHLLALINDVLDFSKIDAGKLELETAPFDLEEAIFDVMDMLSPLAQKHIDMAFYFDDNSKACDWDALRFKQILTNLISNAIKFTLMVKLLFVKMEHDDIGQCLFTLAYKTAVLVSVEPTVKNYLSLSLKVMLRHPPIWWYRTWA
jgi:two-component system sensor histidine kinase BarA